MNKKISLIEMISLFLLMVKVNNKTSHKKKAIEIGKKTLFPNIPYPTWMVKDKFKDED